MKLCLALLTVGTCVSVALAQYDGPVPPRPVIPGAVPAGGARQAVRRRPVSRVLDEPPQRRQSGRASPRRLPPPPLLEQSLQARPAQSRDYEDVPIRRQSLRAGPRRFPVAPDLPVQPRQQPQRPVYQESPISVVRAPVLTQPQHNISPRPVIEDEEEEDEEALSTFPSPSPTPQAAPPPPPTIPPPQPSPQLFSNLENFPVPTRQQYRPQPEYQPEEEPQQQYFRTPRPQPTRQQQQETVTRQEPARPKPYAQQQYNRQQQVARPAQKEVVHSKASESTNNRQRKPTSQVLKKYRDDNADGTIVWGYENDDGSFKEETIGTDCVTRGKYGYVDPDGVRREFTYSSGIPCDKNRDSETQASEGYIDYTNNKYVFPNGETIDINSMVRNRARKPVYRN
uniref:Uncharacterized protein n=3 Tax=Lygus hesperus TaxID=30085 RepID=A0A146LPI5_LYGHE